MSVLLVLIDTLGQINYRAISQSLLKGDSDGFKVCTGRLNIITDNTNVTKAASGIRVAIAIPREIIRVGPIVAQFKHAFPFQEMLLGGRAWKSEKVVCKLYFFSERSVQRVRENILDPFRNPCGESV